MIEVCNDEVVVMLQRTEACAKCKACTAGFSKEEMIIRAKNICGATEKQWVSIELEHSNFLTAVLIMYGIPLVALMTGLLSGYYFADQIGISDSALIGFILGIVLMCLSYLWIRSKEDKWKDKKFIPIATEIVTNTSLSQ